MEENRNWRANWIRVQDRSGFAQSASQEVCCYRRTFVVPEAGGRLVVRVSADSRYRLYLNGESVSVGPCKGDGNTHYYETADLTPRLKPGVNALAAKVVHYRQSQPYASGDGPVSVWRSAAGAFLLEGELLEASGVGVIETLHSDERWKCIKDESGEYSHGTFTFFVGGVEKVDGKKLPHGWESIEYDDSDWPEAAIVCATSDPHTGQLTPWQLAERPIPPLYERPAAFKSIVRSAGMPAAASANAPVAWPMRFPPRASFMLELDAGELTTGYLNVKLTGGAGSRIRLLCSECYEPPADNPEDRRKGVRDRSEGNVLLGEYDEYAAAGIGTPARPERYEPFWFRTFRYVRVEIETGDEPLVVVGLDYRDTGYPLEVRTTFACSDPGLAPLWDISLRTLQRCMHETYEDCPYYEQLQYIMDTRLQILFTYNISGDDRLARRAIYDFHSSLLPSGMLQSRYPSVYGQVIPGFALYWIGMLHDHYMYFGDDLLARRYRPTVDAVLDWFGRTITDDGIVGACPSAYWSYVDWVEEWKDTTGMPTAGLTGPITVYSLMYVAALEAAADLNEWTGRGETAREYRERGDAVKTAVRAHCWSERAGLFRDGPHSDDYSEHVQIWSVLSGIVTGREAVELLRRTLAEERKLPRVSYAMSFYLFRALSRAGMYDRTFKLWEQWRYQAETLHMTTWLEDPVSQRSDCHAWGAIPLYEFPVEILGIRPGLPGYRRVIVEPRPVGLSWAEGSAMTPHGPVHVSWREDNGRFLLKVNGPEGLPLEVRLPDGTRIIEPNAGSAEASCKWME